MCFPRQDKDSGFTVVELLIVCAIILVITVLALPTMSTVLSSAQSRMSMGEISGLFQASRSDSVRLNKLKSLHFSTVNGRSVVFTQDAAATPDVSSAERTLYLPQNMSFQTAPSGSVSPLDATTLWGNDAPVLSTDPSFNPRGLPCSFSSSNGKCASGSGFVYYFSHAGSLGSTRWSAVSISAAGRIKAWFWNGSSWGD
jgi:prepilin-type N-terminal cleavage/methylation domain-containing protein